MYGGGEHIEHFEKHVANMFGKHAGMFSITGSMAQLIALKIHSTGRNAIFACHPKCHILLHQERAFESLLSFSCLPIGSPSEVLSATSIELGFGKHWKQPSSLVIELPERELGGQTISWKELEKIREYTQSKGIKLHLDGARIWEIQPYYKKSFQEIASLFDSVYVSFYKGLQGSTGAMLLGSEEFIRDARLWQHRFGGRIFHTFPLAIAAEKALNDQISTFQKRADKMREVVHAMTKAQEEFVQAKLKEEPPQRNVLEKIRAKERAAEQAQAKKKAAAATAAAQAKTEEEGTASSPPASTAATSSSSSSPAVAAIPFQPFFSFIPSIPQCSMAHMHLTVSPEVASPLRDSIAVTTGIKLFDGLRAGGKRACVFEWKMGTHNACIDTQEYVRGWTEWMKQRYEQMQKEMMDQ